MGTCLSFTLSRILCVDGDSNTLNWIKATLKDSKVDAVITYAKTGREAFTLLNKEDFDLCILEYALPDMTGVQLCSLMRQMGSKVPMLFFTAMNRSIDREKARAAGAADYLSKPDDMDMIVTAVIDQLTKRKPFYFERPRFSLLNGFSHQVRKSAA